MLKLCPWLEIRISKYFALLLLSFLLTIILRVPYFQHAFIFVDEAWWANGGKAWSQGSRLYHDILIDKNPPIFWYVGSLFQILGVRTLAMHLGSLLLACTTAFLLFLIGSRFFSRAVGAAASIVYALASTTYYTPRIIGMNTESLMMVFGVASLYCFLLGMERNSRCGFFGSGLLAAFAFVTKPVAVAQIAVLVLLLLLIRTAPLGARIRSLILLVDGFLFGVLLFVDWIVKGNTLALWWEQAMLYNFRYVGLIDDLTFLKKLLRVAVSFGLIYAWLWIPILGGKQTERAGPRRIAVWWLLASLLGVIIGRRFYANYFIQAVPAMSLLAAIGAVELWRRRDDVRNRFILRTAGVALCLSVAWFHARTVAHWYFFFDAEAHQRVQMWGMCVEDRNNAAIARLLNARTGPDDALFVWGSKPQLFFLADRRMATPYMDYDVADDMPARAAETAVHRETAEFLMSNPPSYIVDVQQHARIHNYPEFSWVVDRHYDLEEEIHGARLYRLRNPALADIKAPTLVELAKPEG